MDWKSEALTSLQELCRVQGEALAWHKSETVRLEAECVRLNALLTSLRGFTDLDPSGYKESVSRALDAHMHALDARHLSARECRTDEGDLAYSKVLASDWDDGGG